MDATLPDISVALSSFSYSPISGPGHLYKNRVTDEDGMGGVWLQERVPRDSY